jgi:ATP-dependent Clp protease adaptor protein ClpS
MIMPDSVQLKLTLPVVRPLIEIIRQLAGEMPASDGSDPDVKRARNDLQLLLELFSSRFEKKGLLVIHTADAAAILRACAWLRLELRRGAFQGVPDEVLESTDKNGMDQKRPEFSCFLLLATLQLLIIENLPQLADVSIVDLAMVREWLVRRVNSFRAPAARGKPGGPEEDAGAWQVVVRNDPVNLMAYVALVFRVILHMSKEEAERHMREVHEQKSSLVWQGRRREAERRARELRAWHLGAGVRAAQ